MKQPKKLIKDVTFNFPKEDTKCGPHIAYTLPIQGGAASGKNTSFLFKAEEVGEEIYKALSELGIEEVTKDFGLYDNKRRLVEEAVKKQFKDDDEWLWVVDFSETEVYFCSYKGTYSVPYTYDVSTGAVVVESLATPVIQLNMFHVMDGKMKLSEEAEDMIEEGVLVIMTKALEDEDNSEDILSLQSYVEKAAMKKEGDESLPASAYAYTPDKEKVSTWKLRIDDATHVRSAVAALGEGMMGNKVQIPEEDLSAVKTKVRAAYKKFYPENDVPEVLKSVDDNGSDVLSSESSSVSTHDDEITKNKEESMTENVTTPEQLDVEALNKSLAEMQDLLKAEKEAREAAEAKAAEIAKAAEAERIEKAKADMTDVVKGWESVENTEEVVEALFKAEDSAVLIKAMEAMNTRVEEIKKSLGASEAGIDGEITVTSDVNKAKDAVAEILKNRKEKQSK